MSTSYTTFAYSKSMMMMMMMIKHEYKFHCLDATHVLGEGGTQKCGNGARFVHARLFFLLLIGLGLSCHVARLL
jgi:hypothetical protein